MLDNHTLRSTAGSGRVDQICPIVSIGGPCEAISRHRRCWIGEVYVHRDNFRTKRTGRFRTADKDRSAGVPKHEGEPFRWIARVKRDVDATGLQDSERSHHERSGSLDAQAHENAAIDVERAQLPTELVRVPIQLSMSEHSLRVSDSDRIGPSRRRELHEPLDTFRHWKHHRPKKPWVRWGPVARSGRPLASPRFRAV